MKKASLTILIVISLTLSTIAILEVKANPLPDINPKITIQTPQNTTYNTNTITIDLTTESNWGTYNLFYSLDEQKNIPIENMTTVSQKIVNPGFSYGVTRTVKNTSLILQDLSEGYHKVTFYLITDHEISLFRTYEKGEILATTTFNFNVDPPPFPELTGASIAIISTGTLAFFTVYFKKRRT